MSEKDYICKTVDNIIKEASSEIRIKNVIDKMWYEENGPYLREIRRKARMEIEEKKILDFIRA